MPKLVLVDHNGRPLTNDKPPTVVEEYQEDDLPLHVIAERSAQKQSTKAKEAK